MEFATYEVRFSTGLRGFELAWNDAAFVIIDYKCLVHQIAPLHLRHSLDVAGDRFPHVPGRAGGSRGGPIAKTQGDR